MELAEEIRTFMAKKIYGLLENPDGSAKAALARLRRGIGHAPGEIPELWGQYLLELPETLMSHGASERAEPSSAEWAIYTALTMFALHQQSLDPKTEPMHKPGNSLGTAARALMDSEEDRERIARRFNPIATASDMTALTHYLRSFVTMLRAEKIPLDYVRLASDLYFYQNPKTVDKVRLRWGEDFYRISVHNSENSNQLN